MIVSNEPAQVSLLILINNSNNINTQDDIYSAVIMTIISLQEFTRFVWWMSNSAKWPPTLRPSHVIWAVSPPVVHLSSTTAIAVYYYYSAGKLILIYRPTEGRRLSWPRHCKKGAHFFWQGQNNEDIIQITPRTSSFLTCPYSYLLLLYYFRHFFETRSRLF